MPDKIQIVLDADVIMVRDAGGILPDVDIESSPACLSAMC